MQPNSSGSGTRVCWQPPDRARSELTTAAVDAVVEVIAASRAVRKLFARFFEMDSPLTYIQPAAADAGAMLRQIGKGNPAGEAGIPQG